MSALDNVGRQLTFFRDNGKGPNRRLEHAEMTPEKFRTLPGAWFHATYHPEMPTNENKLSMASQEGIHLGSREAAEDRLVMLGPRNEQLRFAQAKREDRLDTHVYMKHDAPGEIHARRLVPGARLANTPRSLTRDAGGVWSSEPNRSQSVYYRNRFEGAGSLSMRIKDDSLLTTHRQAVERAMAAGGRVHPLNRALIEQHGGEGFDVPETRHVTTEQMNQRLFGKTTSPAPSPDVHPDQIELPGLDPQRSRFASAAMGGF